MTLREAYTRKLARHFDSHWEIEDRPRSLEMFHLMMYSCMAKSIVLYIIQHYEGNIKNCYTGYKILWEEHTFLYPDPFHDSLIVLNESEIDVSRIKKMIRASSLYAKKLGGVYCGKWGAYYRLHLIKCNTRRKT